MVATGEVRRRAGLRWRRRGGRSIVVSSWLGFAVNVLLLAAAIALVAAGSAYQGSAIAGTARAQHLRLTNAELKSEFLSAQRSLRGYASTGVDRFLQTYYAQRTDFVADLATARGLAWPAVLPGVRREGAAAADAFRLGDAAVAAPRRSAAAASLYDRVGSASARFTAANERLQAGVARQSEELTAGARRSLGIGQAGATLALAIALLVPITGSLIIIYRLAYPLRRITGTVRRLAAGEHEARAGVPAGPAELKSLAQSVNFLAVENDRMRGDLQRRADLAEVVRRASQRIREHLDAEGVVREAVAAIEEHLGSDFVWVGVIADGELTLPEGNPEDWGLRAAVVSSVPPDYLDWSVDLYRRRGSYVLGDLRSAQAMDLPDPVRRALLEIGAVSLLVVPFGSGEELLGELTLVRTKPEPRPWTAAEVQAAEAVALEVGRGLEHARMYAERGETVAELTELDRAKSEFLASVSHDLRTPLTSITGYAEVLADDEGHPLSEAQRRMVGAIGRNGERLRNLIEDILTMSKIEMGAYQPALRPVDLAGEVRDAVADIRAPAGDKGVRVDLSGPAEGLVVTGDADQLGRALGNLLANAVKYTPRGGTITVTGGREDAEAVVSVTDTGIGIPQRDQGSLFTRFFRASNAVSQAIPGTGLGLAIVRAVVDNHQGQVTLSSREGEGTTVVIRLPLLAPDGAPGGDGAPDGAPGGDVAPDGDGGAGAASPSPDGGMGGAEDGGRP